MEDILPIGPDEWENVVEAYSVEFLDWDVDSLQRKYTVIHRKKLPTENLNILEEVRLAKKLKYMIGDWTQLGQGGWEQGIVVHDRFGRGNTSGENGGSNETPDPPVIPSVINIAVNTEDASSIQKIQWIGIIGLKVKKSKKAEKPDFIT